MHDADENKFPEYFTTMDVLEENRFRITAVLDARGDPIIMDRLMPKIGFDLTPRRHKS